MGVRQQVGPSRRWDHDAVHLEDVARDLYGLTPDDFTRARNRRAKEIADSGDRQLASEIRRLPKPSSAAWLANALVRRHRVAVDELTALGPTLRRAQRRAARADMRVASERRRDLVSELVHAASAIAADAGLSLGPNVERQLEQTLDAAVSDDSAALALRSGTLSTPLQFIGFGDSAPPSPSSAERTLSRARVQVEATTASVDDARRRLDDATTRVRSATRELQTAERARADASAALELARQARTKAEREVRDAERQHARRRQPKVKS